MQDLNTSIGQDGMKLSLQAEFQTSNKKWDNKQLELTQLGQRGGLYLYVGGWARARVHSSVRMFVNVH